MFSFKFEKHNPTNEFIAFAEIYVNKINALYGFSHISCNINANHVFWKEIIKYV